MKFQKMFRSVFMFTVIAVLAISPVCLAQSSTDKTTMKEVKQEVREAIQALKSYSIDQKNEAISKTEKALENLDKRIDDLETRVDESWDKMDKAAREQARANLKALRKQRVKLAEWYGSLKNDSGAAWEDLKKGFSDAYDSIHDAWVKAAKEFESEK